MGFVPEHGRAQAFVYLSGGFGPVALSFLCSWRRQMDLRMEARPPFFRILPISLTVMRAEWSRKASPFLPTRQD